MSSEEDARVLTCVGLEADAAADPIVELDVRLRERGFRLGPPQLEIPTGSDQHVVVVLLTPDLLASDDAGAALQELGQRPDLALMPVSLFAGAAPALEDLSQIPLRRFGADRAALRIAIVAEAGAGDLVAWNRLSERASRWDRESRPRAGLLSRRELDGASDLLLRPIARLAGKASQTVGDLVLTSRQRLRRVGQVRWTMAMVIAVAIAATGVVAFGQYQEAEVAAASARLAADAAEAQRLVDEAADQADVDPDLPWLLLDEALRLDPSPAVVASAARTAGTLVPHRTLELRAPALELSAATGSRVAIAYILDHGFDVIDVSSDEVVLDSRSIDTFLTMRALSPDGTRVAATDEDDSLFLVAVEAAASPQPLDVGPARIVSWMDDRRLFVADDDQARVLDVDSGSEVSVSGVDPHRVRGAVANTESNSMVIADSDEVRIHDLTDGSRIGGVPVGGVRGLAVSADGAHVVAQLEFGLQRIPIDAILQPDGSDDDLPLPEAISANVRRVAVTPEGDLVLGTNEGGLAVAPRGGSVVTRQFPAHRAPVSGVAVTDGFGWISAAGDARLRVWETVGLRERFVGDEAVPSFALSQVPISGFEASARGMIDAPADADLATVASPYLVDGYLVNRQSLVTMAASPLASFGTGARFRPTQRPGVVARFDQTGVVSVIDLDDGHVWSADEARVNLGAAETAVSPDGTKVVITGDASSVVWDSTQPTPAWETLEHDDIGSPMHVDVGDDGVVSLIGRRGQVQRTADAGQPLREVSESFSAGVLLDDGEPLLVGHAGLVRRGAGGSLVEVGRVSGDLAPFALRVAPDESHAAIIGTLGTEIIALGSGQVVLRLPSNRGRYHAVTDVLFDADARGLVALRFSGSLSRWPLLDDQSVTALVDRGQPRSTTEEERALFRFSRASGEDAEDE